MQRFPLVPPAWLTFVGVPPTSIRTCVIAALLALLTACASPASEPPAEQPLNLVGSEWQVTRLINPDSGDLPLPDKPLTLHFAAHQRSFGYAGCNRFFAQYRQQESTLQIAHVGSTRQSCRPEHNKIEQRYLRSLLEVRAWERTAQGVRLLNGRGEMLMELAPGQALTPQAE